MTENRRPWQCLNSTRRTVTPRFHYRVDELALTDGSRHTYAYREEADFVVVVPVTTAGQILLVRQYRYPVDEWTIELPAGAIDPPESPAAAAARELREEAGGQSTKMELVGTFVLAASELRNRGFIFVARDVVVGASSPEAGEEVEVVRVDVEEAIEMARSGAIVDATSGLALLRCEHRLRRP